MEYISDHAKFLHYAPLYEKQLFESRNKSMETTYPNLKKLKFFHGVFSCRLKQHGLKHPVRLSSNFMTIFV